MRETSHQCTEVGTTVTTSITPFFSEQDIALFENMIFIFKLFVDWTFFAITIFCKFFCTENNSYIIACC